MELLVAPVTNITFDLELALANQAGVAPLPFPGMDKSGAPVCELYVRSICQVTLGRIRVARLGKFSPIGRLFTSGSFLKIAEIAQIIGLLFPQ
jgi:hypothetical protein